MVPFTLIRKPWFWCIGQIDRKKCIKQWVLRSDRVDCEELTCFFLTCWTPGKMRMFPDHQAYLGIHFGRIPPFVFFLFRRCFADLRAGWFSLSTRQKRQRWGGGAVHRRWGVAHGNVSRGGYSWVGMQKRVKSWARQLGWWHPDVTDWLLKGRW